MRIHQLSALDAVASLKSGAAGLSRADVERRLHEFGRNEVEQVARAPLWLRLAREFTSFFSLTLWVAAGLAFFAEWSDPGQDMAKVGYAIVTAILVTGLFSFWQEYRVEQTLAALRKLLPQQAQVLREGKVTRVPAEQLVPGDVVHLEQGDNIPADCRLRAAPQLDTGLGPFSRPDHPRCEFHSMTSRRNAMAMMKAAVFVEPGRIVLEDKRIPDVGPLDAVIKATTTTICGTDVHILKGEYPVARGLTIVASQCPL